MRLTKVFGLAALAVVAAMAFIGTSSAAAQVDEVTLCKALETLCSTTNLWPGGTEILALAKEPKLKGVLPISCEDSLITGVTKEAVGSPLKAEIKTVVFGKLPKPELGIGCTGCPFGLKTEVHVKPPFNAQLVVTAVDVYKLLVENAKAIVLCGSIECGFEAKDLTSDAITHNGEHAKHLGAKNLAVVPLNAGLTVFLDTSGFGACGTTSTWEAKYVITLAHSGANTGLVWPALDKK